VNFAVCDTAELFLEQCQGDCFPEFLKTNAARVVSLAAEELPLLHFKNLQNLSLGHTDGEALLTSL